jgi:hypothetical protein
MTWAISKDIKSHTIDKESDGNHLVLSEGRCPMRQNAEKLLLINSSTCGIVFDDYNRQRTHSLHVLYISALLLR